MAWPLAGRAQQPERMRRIGALMLWREIDPFSQKSRTAFEQALGRSGWVEGKNIRIDYRFAGGDPTLFKTYAEELVGLAPDVLLAAATPGVAALRQQRAQSRSFLYSWPIPSGRALFRASRGLAVTLRVSAPSTQPCWENGCNCSRRSCRA